MSWCVPPRSVSVGGGASCVQDALNAQCSMLERQHLVIESNWHIDFISIQSTSVEISLACGAFLLLRSFVPSILHGTVLFWAPA